MLLIPDITPAVYQCLEDIGAYSQSLHLISNRGVVELVRWPADFVSSWLNWSELVRSRYCRIGPMNWFDLHIYITLTDPIDNNQHQNVFRFVILISKVSRALCQHILEEYRKMFFLDSSSFSFSIEYHHE